MNPTAGRPDAWKLSQTVQDLRDANGELHLGSRLVDSILNVIRTDEQMLEDSRKFIHSLKAEIERIAGSASGIPDVGLSGSSASEVQYPLRKG